MDGSNGDYEPSTAVALYEYPDEDLDTLPRGLRYEGERRPAEIIEAIQPDLYWLSQKAMEWGHDVDDCYWVTIRAEAYRALARSSMHWNIPLYEDDDDIETDYETYVFGCMIHEELIGLLAQYTLPLQTYGWKGDQLGVWIDWDRIDFMLSNGKIIPIDHADELLDTEWVNGLTADFALMEFEGYVELYVLPSGELLWTAD